ncbi:MAG: SAM-dependent chlorinase/fluorinase [Pseudomonadota bacterium]
MSPLYLFTDFGNGSPYVGQLHGVITATAPSLPIIDLMHDAPSRDPQGGAYLLAAVLRDLPSPFVVCAVIDPGVGSDRLPLAWRCGQHWLVGPDNGLLAVATRRLQGGEPHRIVAAAEPRSRTFHGRDLFAPAAAKLATGQEVGLEPLDGRPVGWDWPESLGQVVYVDAYGNLVTGSRPPGADAAIRLGGRELRRAATFSDVPPGEPFWFENSFGLLEVAVNRGSAAELFGLAVGDPLA